ncbi:MAG: hypothetical protein U9R08_02895 [Nanoarchaeota archaeon]|nr:hypothetical protein [Nanoarchaeota archaeon]
MKKLLTIAGLSIIVAGLILIPLKTGIARRTFSGYFRKSTNDAYIYPVDNQSGTQYQIRADDIYAETFEVGTVVEGKVLIDVDDAEALLVRADGDAGDHFIVDTVNNDIEALVPISFKPSSATSTAVTIDQDFNFKSIDIDSEATSATGIDADFQNTSGDLMQLSVNGSEKFALDYAGVLSLNGTALGSTYQGLDATLTALAGLTIGANELIYGTGADAFSMLGVNSTATNKFLRQVSSGAPSWEALVAGDIPDISATYQPLDTDLTAIAGLTSAADKGIQFTGSGTAGVYDLTSTGKALLDDASTSAQRTTLGLVIGTNVPAINETLYIGTTGIALNRSSATLNLAGIGTLGVGAITTSGDLTLGAHYLGRDTDNTITFATDNQIALKTNGTTAMTINSSQQVGIGEASPAYLLELTHATPYATLHNSAHEDTDGGRESQIIFRGEQSGGEESTLAYIEGSHDGTGDDEKGQIRMYTNNNEGSPALAITIGSDQSTTFAGDLVLNPYTRTIKIPATAARVGATAPTFHTITNTRGLAFDANAELAFIATPIPQDWNGTSDMTLITSFAPQPIDPVANGETVKFDISYNSIAEGEAVDNGTEKTATATYTQSGGDSTDKEMILVNITIDHDNVDQPLTAGDALFIKFNRDVSTDTYSGDAIVQAWALQYTSVAVPK